MKVIFTTNIDNYSNKNCFPKNLEIPPRKGDMVCVDDNMIDYFRSKKLPIRLEVVQVIWKDYHVCCELWYNETDKKMADIGGTTTL